MFFQKMSEIFGKIKNYSKKVALVCSLSLTVFFASFYLVNLDLGSVQKTSSQREDVQVSDLNGELKKRLGSTVFGVEGYEDWAKRYGLNSSNNSLDADPDKEDLPNYLEYIHGTNPLNADTDGDVYSDKEEIVHGYDPDAAGDIKVSTLVKIDNLGVEAPMIWSKDADEKKSLVDLESGVSHYPGSGSPGQNGNMIVSGHSSNYIWAKGDYNHIFKDLNNLDNGDTITVKTIQKNGRIIVYHYAIADKFITTPVDEKIFEATPDQTLTLSTCWPLGTNFKRLIVKAALVK